MKKSILILMMAVCWMAASAAAPERKMLEQGKTWVYVYHHFEENETDYDESTWGLIINWTVRSPSTSVSI